MVMYPREVVEEKKTVQRHVGRRTPPPPPLPPAPTTTAAAATATAAAAAEVKVQSLIAHYVRISYVFYTSIYVRATHGQPSLPQCQCRYYRACAATVAGMV